MQHLPDKEPARFFCLKLVELKTGLKGEWLSIEGKMKITLCKQPIVKSPTPSVDTKLILTILLPHCIYLTYCKRQLENNWHLSAIKPAFLVSTGVSI